MKNIRLLAYCGVIGCLSLAVGFLANEPGAGFLVGAAGFVPLTLTWNKKGG